MAKGGPSANKIAKEIRSIIDAYWANQISEEEARKKINVFLEDPDMRIKIMRRESYTGTFVYSAVISECSRCFLYFLGGQLEETYKYFNV